MAHFKYIGDPATNGSGPAIVEVFGCLFEKGRATEVSDPKAEKKLSRNGHFEKVDGRSMRKPKNDDPA